VVKKMSEEKKARVIEQMEKKYDVLNVVDETILAVCNWIQKEVNEISPIQEKSIFPDVVEALAELVSARAMNN
jgi:hypothetical protein